MAEWGPADAKHREEELAYYGMPVHYGFQRDTSDMDFTGNNGNSMNTSIFGSDFVRKSFNADRSANSDFGSARL